MTSGLHDRHEPVAGRNEVHLVGRLAGARDRVLPSGDRLLAFRLVVPRCSPPRPGPTVDTIDCVGRADTVRADVLKWASGDLVGVEGALRRRFWRTGAGLASRYEVEVATAHRLAVAEPTSGPRRRALRDQPGGTT